VRFGLHAASIRACLVFRAAYSAGLVLASTFLGVMSAPDARKEAEHRGSGLRAATEGAGAPDAADGVLRASKMAA
jgi:hypothetical protein